MSYNAELQGQLPLPPFAALVRHTSEQLPLRRCNKADDCQTRAFKMKPRASDFK